MPGICARRQAAVCAALLLLPVLPTYAGWFRELQVSSDVLVEGKTDFTVRLLPSQSRACDYIEFESFYHQEFPWEDVRGKKYTKIHEPVSYLYRRNNVKLVNDLDCYISFRVPCAQADLQAKYGSKTFNKDYPITLSRIKITGFVDGKSVWTFTAKVGAKLDAATLDQQAAQTNATPQEEAEEAPAVLPPPRPAKAK